MATNGSNTLANELMTSLNTGVSFPVPSVVLTGPNYTFPPDTMVEPEPLETADLTTRTVGGDGVFDALMDAFNAHISREFEKGRISGDQYAKAYVELTAAAMGQAVQFVLGKDQAYWAAMTAQRQARIAEIQAVSAGVELETAKVQRQMMAYQAVTQEAEYALTKVKLANEDINYGINKYRLSDMLPQEKAVTQAQAGQIGAQTLLLGSENSIANYRLTQMMPQEKLLLTAQTTQATNQATQISKETDILTYRLSNLMPAELAGMIAQNALISVQQSQIQKETLILDYRYSFMLPVERDNLSLQGDLLQKQVSLTTIQSDKVSAENARLTQETLLLLPEQIKMVKEQTEAQRAQTHDNRSDGTSVTGVLGKQKLLYAQQTTAYLRDSEIKAGKMFLDAFITQKTIDEATLVPTALGSANISTVMTTIKNNNSL